MASIQADSKIQLRDGFKTIADVVSIFDQSLAHDLEQLGELLYRDVDTGLPQLREGLPRILRNPKPSGKSSDGAQFFKTYKLPDGEGLSTDSVHKLVRIASSFPSGPEAERNEQAFTHKFGDNPESFWSLLSRLRDSSNISIIRHISESVDEQDLFYPIRRRIMLSVLFERVQLELERIWAEGNILKRGQTLKGVANDALLELLWKSTDQSTKRKRRTFNQNVRAGGKWKRFEPGVLIGLADQQAWILWERSMNDGEFNAITDYMSSLPAHERWKRLSPLASELKSAFLRYLTGDSECPARPGSGKRKRVGENGNFQEQNRSRQKRRANAHASNGYDIAPDTVLSRDHSQPLTPVSHPPVVSNKADSLQVLAEVATTTGPISIEYSTPLLDTSFMNEINDFGISAGHKSFIDGVNYFDISGGLREALQPPPVGSTSFMAQMNDFDNPDDPNSVSRPPSLGAIPPTDGMNDFDISAGGPAVPQPSLDDIFANTSSNFEIPHEDVIDSSSFNQSMNDFDISAG